MNQKSEIQEKDAKNGSLDSFTYQKQTNGRTESNS